MDSKLLATSVAVVACLALAGGARAQDLGSTMAGIGAAANIGTGIGTSARALETARGAGPTARGLDLDEVDAPGKGGAGGGGEGAAGKGGGATRERGLYLDDDDDDDDGPDFVGTAPDEYQVRKGDTLWDLCGRYMGDPWAWPRVWAMNPSVTNPHWIFPGDRLRFGGSGAKAVAAAPARAKGPRLTITRAGAPVGRALLLRTNGFVTTKELAGSSKVIGSREEKELLTVHDQVYVEFPSDKPLKVGERYTIYRPKYAIKHPVGGAVVGNVVEIMGEVQIEQITQGRIARGTILEVLGPIERGFRVGTLLRQIRPVERRPNKVQLEAYLLGMIRTGQMIGATELIFVDKGKKQGVEEGSLFYVIRRGDGNRPMMERIGADQDARFPKEVVAEIVVVEVRDETSVGWVTRSTKEIKAGDKLEMRKGY
ncbi:MAG: LysM peptidoglycan-binding domain-containing protein [Deltaproteobacteria bacterium]|nr:LysM peptidoglycan-binding domain-containing protein [Deltaproteobacteria bacterium]